MANSVGNFSDLTPDQLTALINSTVGDPEKASLAKALAGELKRRAQPKGHDETPGAGEAQIGDISTMRKDWGKRVTQGDLAPPKGSMGIGED